MAGFTFYYDVVCPYAYLASTQIEAMAARAGAEIEWVPVLLGGQASPQTREILTTGVHPMMAKAEVDSSASMVMAADTVPTPDPSGSGVEPPARRRQRLAAQGFGNIPELTGLAQVVGLALGSPEFQRR